MSGSSIFNLNSHPAGVTRLAPSPTGALHLGNARTFLINWLLARQNGWRIVLRIEDIDGPRIKPGADDQAIQDLRWLGLNWDEGPIYQLPRLPAYRAALDRLVEQGNAYPCVCTRTEIERAASAPHADDGSAVYPGTCRGRFESMDAARAATGRDPAIRFRVEDDEVVSWTDRFAGEQSISMGGLGDFVVAKGDGTPAYQLAVVVDDAAAGVTEVVRGDDLLDSTPRQIVLYRALGLGSSPGYAHLPLVVGTDGRRLAKRHGDTRLASYRASGRSPGDILRALARGVGISEPRRTLDQASDLLGEFDLARVPRRRIVLSDRDDLWLETLE